MSIRPLKKQGPGRYASRCGVYLFVKGEKKYGMRVFWHIYNTLNQSPEPINWCNEHSTLRGAVAFVEYITAPPNPVHFDCQRRCRT